MSAPLQKICIVCRREFPAFVLECPDDRVRLSEKDTRLGTIFDGKYEILDFVGAGGLSRVYRARHIELNRVIALKVLRSLKLEDLQRFRREAVSFAKLEHPNIAKIFAFAVSPDGCPYLAIEYLEGRDLSSYLAREGPLPLKDALSIFEQACAALEHAHLQSIIHRDIKPSNIVLLSEFDQSGGVKVVDFGMAKFMYDTADADQQITQEGDIFGTRQYISPEQYHGHKCDERADIYALGVSLYESVVVDGKIPELLQGIIKRATESDPEKRYQTATEFRKDLSNLREALLTNSTQLFKIVAGEKKTKDFFGTFYFWTMVIGMIVVSIAAAVVVKQRLAALDSVPLRNHKSMSESIIWKKPLSFAATESLTTVLVHEARYNDAQLLWQKWLEHNQNAEWTELLQAKKQLAACFQNTEQRERAIDVLSDAVRTYEEHHAEKSADCGDMLNALAVSQYQAGRYDESLQTAQKLLDMKDAECSKRRFEEEIYALLTQSRCYIKKGELSSAENLAKKAEQEALKHFDSKSSSFADSQSVMTDIALLKENLPAALEYIDKAIVCCEANSYKLEPSLFENYRRKAEILIKIGDKKKLEQLYKIMQDRLVHSKQPGLVSKLAMERSLNVIATYLGKTEEAKKWADN